MNDRDASFARLAWTSGALAFAVAPHTAHLETWVPGAALLTALWRLLAERRRWRLPSRALKTGIAFAAAAAVVASYRSISGVEAGTALLVVMAALKLLETRASRDHVVLVFIGFFLCLAAFLYAQRLTMLAWVVPAVWLLAAALLNVSRIAAGGPRLRPFRTTGAMLLKALPLMLVLFLFFPRVQGHFWGAPAGERAVTGLDDEMSPGDLSELTLSDTVAFRVRFAGPLPPPRDRYWRGPVLSEFDGFTWRRPASQAYLRDAVAYEGAPVDYRVTLEPHRRRWLFALDMPSRWPESMARRGWDYLLYAPSPVNAVVAYDVRSYPRYRAGTEIGAAMRRHHLQLPPGRNPRTLALARQMRSADATDAEYIGDVLRMFREQEYFYTLEPPRLERDSVDDFLFNTRRGFCGHFASAFTTMMRAAGLPARVVTGYQGGEFNTMGGYLMVRQSQAHAWSEVWLEGRGWTRVDPTAAVAPERVERGLEAALPEGEPVPGRLLRDFDLAWQARLVWDAVNERWNDWVVEFDSMRQERMLSALGVEDADWRKLAAALGIGLAGGLLLLSAWLAWEFRPPRRDPAARAYDRYVARLAARGLARPPHEGPYDYLRRVTRYRPDLAGSAGEITEAYARLRYAPSPSARDLERLERLVRGFRP